MPQNPIQTLPIVATTPKYNITAAAVVKATPGTLATVTCIAPGTTSGALTLNDCAAVADAAATNEILTVAFGDLKAGQVITLNWPCKTGIVVSAVPGAGSPQFAVAYT